MKKMLFLLMTLGALAGQNVCADDSVADKAGAGIKKGGEAAGRGIEKGADATGKGIKKGLNATGKGLKKAGEWISKKTHQGGSSSDKASE